jgi:alpha-methylacyl-CoA racemase
MQARGTYVEVDGVVQPAAAPRFDRSVPEPPKPVPEPGAHTAQVLAEAGFDAAAIEALRAAGAIR